MEPLLVIDCHLALYDETNKSTVSRTPPRDWVTHPGTYSHVIGKVSRPHHLAASAEEILKIYG